MTKSLHMTKFKVTYAPSRRLGRHDRTSTTAEIRVSARRTRLVLKAALEFVHLHGHQ